MSESATVPPEVVLENSTASTNATGRTPSTPEGMAIAYGSLVIMALLPILIGAFRSVRHHKEQKVILLATSINCFSAIC